MKRRRFRSAVTGLAVLCGAVGCGRQVADTAPPIEELQARYEGRFLAEIARNDDLPMEDVGKAAVALAREVFGGHPQVLRAKAEERFRLLPPLDRDVLDGSYTTRHTLADFPRLFSELASAEDFVIGLGWDPAHVADMAWPSLLKEMTTAELDRLANLETHLPYKTYRVPGGERTVVAVRSPLDDFFLVELRLNAFGVFVPVSVRWMTPTGAGPSGQSGSAAMALPPEAAMALAAEEVRPSRQGERRVRGQDQRGEETERRAIPPVARAQSDLALEELRDQIAAQQKDLENLRAALRAEASSPDADNSTLMKLRRQIEGAAQMERALHERLRRIEETMIMER